MHFQAAPAEEFPLLEAIRDKHRLLRLRSDDFLEVAELMFYGCRYLVARGANRGGLCDVIEGFIAALDARQPGGGDLVNIMVRHGSGGWEVVLCGRSKHRPHCFFADEEDRLLVSPACVELAGVVVAPRREDYERINGQVLAQIFSEVTLSKSVFEEVVREL